MTEAPEGTLLSTINLEKQRKEMRVGYGKRLRKEKNSMLPLPLGRHWGSILVLAQGLSFRWRAILVGALACLVVIWAVILVKGGHFISVDFKPPQLPCSLTLLPHSQHF